MKKIGIYVHIPFCVKKCLYCDFISFASHEGYFEAYKNALIEEIRAARQKSNSQIASIFIGGGTPTILPSSYIEEVMLELSKFNLSESVEITIEANPKTLSLEMLKNLKKMGINRLSIGLQAWQNLLLKTLGRSHSLEDFLRNFQDARSVGFNNISIDLMFALPNQTLEMWQETLEQVISLNPEHVSLYSLIIEEGTHFFDLYDSIDEALDRKMYHLAKKLLEENGYKQYEISNFSKLGLESKHNLLYWEMNDYYGFGLNAHSMLDNTRFSNTSNLKKYINNPTDSKENIITLSEKDIMEESIFLGLRKTSGVDISKYFDIYKDVIEKNIALGLLKMHKNIIFLTEKGMDLANIVMAEFILW